MKATGIIRHIDELGRIVLPIEMRRVMELGTADRVEIYVEGDKIILKKHQESCIFCGSSDALTDYNGKHICAACLQNLKGK